MKRPAKRLLTFLLVLSASGGIFFSIHSHKKKEKLEKGFHLLSAASTRSSLIELTVDYCGTPVGESACFRLSQLEFSRENYEDAVSRFALFLKEYPTSEHLTEARFGLAQSLEKIGKYAEASLLYKSLLSELDNASGKTARKAIQRCETMRADQP